MPSTLATAIFWSAATSCLVAQVALVRSAMRSPMSGPGDTPVTMPRRSTEIAWTIVPALALALLFASTWRAMQRPAMSSDMSMPAGHRMIDE